VVICRLGAYGERRRLVLKRRQQAWAVSCQRTVNLNDEGRRTKDEGIREFSACELNLAEGAAIFIKKFGGN
jgi:hypothetical protein